MHEITAIAVGRYPRGTAGSSLTRRRGTFFFPLMVVPQRGQVSYVVPLGGVQPQEGQEKIDCGFSCFSSVATPKKAAGSGAGPASPITTRPEQRGQSAARPPGGRRWSSIRPERPQEGQLNSILEGLRTAGKGWRRLVEMYHISRPSCSFFAALAFLRRREKGCIPPPPPRQCP